MNVICLTDEEVRAIKVMIGAYKDLVPVTCKRYGYKVMDKGCVSGIDTKLDHAKFGDV